MNDNQPPIQSSSSSMPPVGSYQPQAPRPKPKVLGWIIAAGIALVVICGFCGLVGYFAYNHTNVVINGKELTAGELAKGKLEILEMSKNVKEGDLTSFDTSIETTSPLSSEFKRCFIEIQKAEKTMEKANNDLDVDKATRMMIESQSSRDQARAMYEGQNKIAIDYLDTESKSIQTLMDLTRKFEPESLSGFQKGANRLTAMKPAYQEMINDRTAIFDFLDKTPHSYQNSTAAFAEDKQIATYNELQKKYRAAAQKIIDISKT